MEQETKDVDGDARLRQLFIKLLKIFGVLVVVFVVVYSFGQRTNSVPVTPQSEVNITSAESAVRANPNDVSARIKLADAYLRAGRSEDALSQLNEILQADSTNRAALMGVATILYDQGDYQGAKERLQVFVQNSGTGEFATQDTQLERAYYMLGEISEKSEDNTSAVAFYKKALAINGGDADAWFRLGTVLNVLGQYKDAAASFEQVLAFIPEGWCEPYSSLAISYQGLKDNDGSTFAAAMAKVCDGAGLADAAQLTKLVDGKYKVEALLGLGLAAEHDHEFDKALAYYKQVTAVDKTNVAAVNAIARIKANASTPAA